ncbi:hypothetical protein ALC57_01028 [Trachymyrmex cornetzi]|uniref:CCHC-type domain-containing protein n=1 Tax=Trachymyrmex cornetzi TaxID=471704 RepID=A0A151JQK7_9HYME|nr:hypothetical protein ALC57_01028 [Trachymyrmex cornetzi]
MDAGGEARPRPRRPPKNPGGQRESPLQLYLHHHLLEDGLQCPHPRGRGSGRREQPAVQNDQNRWPRRATGAAAKDWTRTATSAADAATAAATAAAARAEPPPGGAATTASVGGPPKLRSPGAAAVTVTCLAGTYAEVMRRAPEHIDLREMGVEGMRIRRGVSGALILEIPGSDGPARADTLAAKLREALEDREGVKIGRPHKTVDVRIRDLEDSISPEEVAAVIAERGACVRGLIKVGAVTVTGDGLGSVWVRCSAVAARKLAAEGRITIGWSRCGVEILPRRPLQCFRCMGVGHVRATCPSATDRSGCCYRCGAEGHVARDCIAAAGCCLLCKDAGRKAVGHRAGGGACPFARGGDRLIVPTGRTRSVELGPPQLSGSKVSPRLRVERIIWRPPRGRRC